MKSQMLLALASLIVAAVPAANADTFRVVTDEPVYGSSVIVEPSYSSPVIVREHARVYETSPTVITQPTVVHKTVIKERRHKHHHLLKLPFVSVF